MKKLFLLAALFSLSLCGCNNSGGEIMSSEESSSQTTSSEPFVPEPDDGNYDEVTKLVRLANGKTIVHYKENGEWKPLVGTGIQIRTDAYMNTDGLKMEEMEIFFAKAKELGVTTVEVPVEWKDVEVGDNVWDFTYMKQLLDFVNKYNLKLELLWFGSNMCGDTHSYSTPEYILTDGKTYTKCDARRTGEFWDYYGVNWHLDHGDDDLIMRESYAMKKVLKYVYEYNRDTTNNPYPNKYPLVAFQVLNEADIFARFRIVTKYVRNPATNELYTFDDAFASLKKAYSAYGKAVKESKYRVYTRVNLASSLKADQFGHQTGIYDGDSSKSNVKHVPDWVEEIAKLDGIDCVGDDPYFTTVKEIKGVAYMFANNVGKDNYSHVAENYGRLANTPQLILAAFSQGSGYNIYDLASSPFFINHGSAETDQGITRYSDEIVTDAETGEPKRVQTFTDHAHFVPTAKICKGLALSGANALEFDPGDFACFNCYDEVAKNKNQTVQTSKARFTFITDKGALAFAACNGNVIDIYATENASINIEGVSVSNIKKLSFADDGVTINEQTLSNPSASISLEGGYLYRVECSSVGAYLSNTWENIG